MRRRKRSRRSSGKTEEDLSLGELHDRLTWVHSRIAELSAALEEFKEREQEWLTRTDEQNAKLEREINKIKDREKSKRGYWTKLFCGDFSDDARIEIHRLERQKINTFRFYTRVDHILADNPELKDKIYNLRVGTHGEKLGKQLQSLERTEKLYEYHIKKKQREQIKAEKQKQREQAKEEKRKLLEAAAAAHFGRTREKADAIKHNLSGQVNIYPNCPYCDGVLGEQPHADHIFPVSRGGLSTPDNLVLVCDICNSKKTNKTLREFIISENLDRTRIERVLIMLGKRF